MANFSMPWVQDAFDRKTLWLSKVQKSAYEKLLKACFNVGGEIPDDDKKMAAICEIDVRTWRKHKSVVMSFFYRTADGWRQERVDEDLERLADLRAKRSAAGKKGAVIRMIKQHRRR